MSPYTTTLCGFFSSRKHTCPGLTPHVLNRVTSSFVVQRAIFLHSWIYVLCAFANGSLFTTHICSNRFIDQSGNPVASGKREDIPQRLKLRVGSRCDFLGEREWWFQGKVHYLHRMIGTHSCFVLHGILPSFFLWAWKESKRLLSFLGLIWYCPEGEL